MYTEYIFNTLQVSLALFTEVYFGITITLQNYRQDSIDMLCRGELPLQSHLVCVSRLWRFSMSGFRREYNILGRKKGRFIDDLEMEKGYITTISASLLLSGSAIKL